MAASIRLIEPYGGELVSLLASGTERDELLRRAAGLASVTLPPRSLSDLELLATGGFSPLGRFMGRRDYLSVVERGRLADGTLFPTPVVLSAPDSSELRIGQEVALRTARNNVIAWMRIEERFESGLVSGELKVLELPARYDFPELRLTPAQVREQLSVAGNERVLAFQTLRPMRGAEEAMTKRAAAELGATLLLQPLAGLTQAGELYDHARVRACKALVRAYYEPRSTVLNLIPLIPPDACPQAALLQAIVARNYGATHLLLNGEFAEAGSAARLLAEHAGQLGVHGFVGNAIAPALVPHPEIEEMLAAAHPPRHHQGFCVWLTGLPCAGKSTIAEVLANLLLQQGRQVTILDGDVVRTHLSRGLGFSHEDRDTNILRIGFVAAEIVRHQGAVICAAVSPYQAARQRVREMMPAGQFVEVLVNTPLEVCEHRDVRGNYARARAGQLKAFTGVDDPYEPPAAPELTLDTVSSTPLESARQVFEYLGSAGFLAPTADAG